MFKIFSNKLRASSDSNMAANGTAAKLEGLNDDLTEVWSKVPPTRNGLAKLREKARRCGAWFRRLRKNERDYIDLVIMVVKKINSPAVKTMVAKILNKLLTAMRGLGGDIQHMMDTIGIDIAQKLSQTAQIWGNKHAAQWQKDRNFIRYLTVMYLNKTPVHV